MGPWIDPNHRITEYAKLKDSVSILNGLFGFMAILMVSNSNFVLASVFMVLAVAADVLDGKIARHFSEPTAYGRNIDIADLISFGVAPAFFLMKWVDFIYEVKLFAALALVTACLMRLSRFLTKEDTKEKITIGVPTTMNGILFPAMFFAGLWAPGVIVITFIQSYLLISAIRWN